MNKKHSSLYHKLNIFDLKDSENGIRALAKLLRNDGGVQLRLQNLSINLYDY
jgi:hypothetical protein